MNHIDLFSGIGGFALAASWCWGDEYINVAHSEIEKFPCQIYHKHFPESECLGDITKIEWGGVIENSERLRCNGRERKVKASIGRFGKSRSRNDGRIHLLTGGFPCQPFSVAGKRRGKEDDRALWHEMLRAIREIRPAWVIGENVAGIIKMELNQVLSDLESEAYEVQPFVIPACAVNAPHRRDRVWIVAHNAKRGLSQSEPKSGDQIKRCSTSPIGTRSAGNNRDASNTTNNGLNRNDAGSRISGELAADKKQSRSGWTSGNPGRDWEQSWYEVATRLCRVDDGVPRRVDRLKSLGNAIVPQVAFEIMKAIKETG